jgi:TonB family protein
MATKAPPIDARDVNVAGTLLFSRPPKLTGLTAESFSASLVFHVLLGAATIWITLHPVKKEIAAEDVLIPMIVQEEAEQKLPPPPPPPPDQKPISLEEIPKGFQTLTMPTVVPIDIPPPTVGPEIDEADFSGEGKEGGLARGQADPSSTKTVSVEDIEASPAFTPYTVAPELKNRQEIAQLLVRWYPQMLRDAQIGGTVMVWILVDERGGVRRSVVKTSSEMAALDSVALKVTNRMVFSPAQNRDMKVPVWVAIPVTFAVQ